MRSLPIIKLPVEYREYQIARSVLIKMASVRTIVAATVLATSTFSVLIWCAWKYRASKKKVARKRIVNKVMFFPDLATSLQLSSSNSKSSDSLISPQERELTGDIDHGSMWELFSALQQARHSIDVCVLVIASQELSDVLIGAHQSGVIVRVVTDDNPMNHRTQVHRLRHAGIQVRIDETGFLMHHKFAVIDGELLMSGSLNWTTQALCGNQENVILTNEVNLVRPFLEQFELLWEKYDPQQNSSV